MDKLIDKIVRKITVDYCRLSIVGNQDGFLTRDDVRRLIYQHSGIEVVAGSNLQLRIHYELEYKSHPDARYIYVSQSIETLLVDMRQSAYLIKFSISDLFPMFADKSLLRKQDYEVIDKLYEQVAQRRVTMGEGTFLIENVKHRIAEEKSKSCEHLLAQLQRIDIDWNHAEKTIAALAPIIIQSIKNDCYDEIDEKLQSINQNFQRWVDEHYFAMQNSNPLLKAQCVNKILPYQVANHSLEDRVALVVVDGLAYWQYAILRNYFQQQGIRAEEKITFSWLPSITMLSRQAIFRGAYPSQDYKQSPENERKLWIQYWQKQGFTSFEMQYLSDKDEFAINEGVKRLAYVTVEMDEKMHSSTDYKDLCSLTENWCPRLTEKIKTLLRLDYTIYLTTDHGNVLSHGWRKLSAVEKVFLYKDGSRGKRHLIYNNKVEQDSFFEENKAKIPLLQHEDWLAVRNDACFENEGQTIITHGGSHFMEMVIPFVKIERNP